MAASYSDAIAKIVYRTLLKMYVRGFTRREMETVISKGVEQAKDKFNALPRF